MNRGAFRYVYICYENYLFLIIIIIKIINFFLYHFVVSKFPFLPLFLVSIRTKQDKTNPQTHTLKTHKRIHSLTGWFRRFHLKKKYFRRNRNQSRGKKHKKKEDKHSVRKRKQWKICSCLSRKVRFFILLTMKRKASSWNKKNPLNKKIYCK